MQRHFQHLPPVMAEEVAAVVRVLVRVHVLVPAVAEQGVARKILLKIKNNVA